MAANVIQAQGMNTAPRSSGRQKQGKLSHGMTELSWESLLLAARSVSTLSVRFHTRQSRHLPSGGNAVRVWEQQGWEETRWAVRACVWMESTCEGG